MNMKELEGMQPMEHVPQEEREKVGQQRWRDLGLLYERISKLKDRLERKEERLREYETSIEQLRYSEVMGVPPRSDGVRACSIRYGLVGQQESLHILIPGTLLWVCGDGL